MERNYKPNFNAPGNTGQRSERKTSKRRWPAGRATCAQKPHSAFADWFAFQSQRF